MKMLSPGVYTSELDFSFYAMELASSIFGVVLTADKGPINEVTLITNEGDLVNTFGNPESFHYGLLSAIRYLRRGRALKVVRVAGAGYDTASGTLQNVLGYNAVTVNATSAGSWGNSTSVKVEPGTSQGFKITVYSGNNAVEGYDDVVLDSTNSYFIETIINGVSAYITVTVTDSTQDLANATVTLSGGDSGNTVTSADIIGTMSGGVATGLQLFRNTDRVDLNLLAVPGYSAMVPTTANAIVSEVIDIAQTRGDTLSLISAPYGLTVNEVIDWHNGNLVGPGNPTQALNSSYAALYWPWLEIYDPYSASELWIPSEGSVAGICAFTDQSRELWFAPAGLQRGRLQDVLAIEYSPDLGQRDALYGGLQRVNPFVDFEPDGITLWGQQTLYRANSALTSVHVRRLMNYVEKVVATSVRYLVFEPNDDATWREFRMITDPIFANIKSRRGFYDYRIICDETTNTPARIDKGEMWGRILVKPTRAAEKIAVEFAITQTGALFDEFAGIA